jgi:hypothetical protein
MNGSQLKLWQTCGRTNSVRLIRRLLERDPDFDRAWYAFSDTDRAAMAVCAAIFVVTGGVVEEVTIDCAIRAIGGDVSRVKAVLAWAKPSDDAVRRLRHVLLR